MSQEVQIVDDEKLSLISQSQCMIGYSKSFVQTLMQTPHYKKMGESGLLAIVSTAQSLNIDPIIALGGALYYTPQGRVEMSSRLMNMLIRRAKHSLSIYTDSEKCEIKGKRSDNGDECIATFTVAEAKKIGLMSKQNWKDYTEDMLFARALSRIARRLFPDVIGDCYVEGEVDLQRLDEMQAEEIITPLLEEKPKEEKKILDEKDIEELSQKVFFHFNDKIPDAQYLVKYFMERKGLREALIPDIDKAFSQIKKMGDKFLSRYSEFLSTM